MIDSKAFKEEILDNKRSGFIAFVASWCAPSQQQKEVFEELSVKYGDNLSIDCIDVDLEPDLANEYSARSLPTILSIDEGEIVETIHCFQSKQDLCDVIDFYLKEKELQKNLPETENSKFSTLRAVFARLKEAFRFH